MKLLKQEFDDLTPGLFASGELPDDSTEINMIGSSKILRWVAVKGYGNDWAIYAHWKTNSIDYIMKSGDKINNVEHIKRCIDCDDEVLNLYRH